MIQTLKDIGILLSIPLLRNVFGYVQVMLADDKVEKYEIVKLVETIYTTIISTLAVYYSINFMGLDISMLSSSIAVVTVDWFVRIYKKIITKKE